MQDMNSPDNLTRQEQAFADSLAAFKPVPPEIPRDTLLFAAGQASVRCRSVWPWQAATGASLAFALCMLAMLPLHPHAPANSPLLAVTQPPPQRSEASLPISASAVFVSPQTPDDSSYLRTRENVLALGVAALPSSAGFNRSTSDDTHALSAWQVKAYLHQGAE